MDRPFYFVAGDALYRVPAGGGPAAKVRTLDVTAYALDVSPDGTRVAYATGNPDWVGGSTQFANQAPGAILVASLSGGDPQAITDLTHLNTSPMWMPDGHRLLFVSDSGGSRDIYLTTVDEQGHASEASRLTTGLGAHTIDVSADGRHLAYSVLMRLANAAALPIAGGRVLGAADLIPLTRGNQTVEDMGASPDGRSLFFDADLHGNTDIFRMSLPGGRPEPLTKSEADEFFNDVSPDGTEVAYHAMVNGRRQVYVMPGGGGASVLVGPGLGAQWSPDGRRLVMAVRHEGEGPPAHAIVERTDDGSWGPSRVLRRGPCVDVWRWREDGRALIALCDGAIAVLDLEGHVVSRVYAPEAESDPAPAFVGKVLDDTVWFKAYDGTGTSFWSVPVSGGKPRLRARLSDSAQPSSRVEFNNDRRYVYLTVDDRQADVWSTEIGQARR